MALSKPDDHVRELSPWTATAEWTSWLAGVSQAVTELVEDTTGLVAGSSFSGAARSSEACSSSKRCLDAGAVPVGAMRLFAAGPMHTGQGAPPALRARGWLDGVLRAGSAVDPLAGLAEVAEDLELGKSRTALLLPITLSLLSGPSASAVWLCGLSLPTKVTYGAVAAAMAAGAWSMRRREPLDTDRTMQDRCALALCASSGLHLAMAVMGAVPDPLAAWALQPEVAAHFVQDFVVGPMLILNLGHLVGMGPRRMLPCVGLNVASTCGAIGAAVVHTHSSCLAWGLVSVGSMACAVYNINQLPAKATSFSTLNTTRCQVAGDLLAFSWMLSSLTQLLGLEGVLSVPHQLHVFAVTDIVSKIGTCHLVLRSPAVIRSAAQHFEAEQLASSASTDR